MLQASPQVRMPSVSLVGRSPRLARPTFPLGSARKGALSTILFTGDTRAIPGGVLSAYIAILVNATATVRLTGYLPCHTVRLVSARIIFR